MAHHQHTINFNCLMKVKVQISSAIISCQLLLGSANNWSLDTSCLDRDIRELAHAFGLTYSKIILYVTTLIGKPDRVRSRITITHSLRIITAAFI